jgi:RNA polymerase sigma factor (sigma-70 family)
MESLSNDPSSLANPVPSESEESDRRLACFDQCLATLSADVRELIINYYQEEKHAKIIGRQQLADQFGIPLNALRIRVHRIRKTLEACIQDCLAQHA